MRFQFILSEIKIGLRRNLTMTISLILVTMVSMVLLGIGLLTQKQVDLMKGYWYDRVQVSVFLCTKASETPTCSQGEVTQAQRDQIQAELNGPQLAPLIEQVYFESKQEAYKHFKEQYKDSILVDNVTPDQMPESYRVKLKDPKQYEQVSAQFTGRAGVDTVENQSKILDRLFSLLQGLKWATWALAGLTLVSAVLLVATTIRLAAFTRRRETAIMRLVGASNWVIRMPFMLESIFAAVVGVLLAIIMLLLGTKVGVNTWLADKVQFNDRWVSWTDVLLVAPWMLLVAMLIAGISSLLVLRRYLKV